MRYNFPYLTDSSFLKRFDKTKLKEQLVKIFVLNFKEQPIEEIQGKVLSGNFTIDGSSSMRRTGSISFIASNQNENDLMNIKNLLSINKKIEVLIGFVNTTEEYTQYDILWFPQGIFIITAPNINYNGSDGIGISLTLHDKMALLNGECGGTLPATVIFHQIQDTDEEGNTLITNPTIYQIIQELVNHFGGEQLGKIIISDVPNQIKKVMKWTGATPLYLGRSLYEGCPVAYYETNYNEITNLVDDVNDIKTYSYGEDIGYILTDFTFPGELVGNAGDTVVTILDQIKNVLGNYQYFYDLDGNFRFQQIKNYLNKSYSTSLINQLESNDYLADYVDGKSVYTFNDMDIIQSISVTPQYQQIKNDFLVWGKRKNIEGKEVPIRYHLAIDSKPFTGNQYQVFFYLDQDDNIYKAKKPLYFNSKNNFPKRGEYGKFYYSKENDKIYKWNFESEDYELTSYTLTVITTNDYRDELYFSGVQNDAYGLESTEYYTELKTEWPKLYDIKEGKFFDQVLKTQSDIDYYLDIIDNSTPIYEFSIENIGKRTTTLVDDSINCIFEPDNPDIVIISTSEDETNTLRDECIARKQQYSQVKPQIYSLLENGGVLKSAYEEIRKQLYLYTTYNEQISLTLLPIYYLEPNTRITINSKNVGINGDYIIRSISLPLNIEGTMTLSCTKALERI